MAIISFCKDLILQISQPKIKDKYSNYQLKIIHALLGNLINLTKVFFSFKRIPIPELTSQTILALTEPLDPMRFTQLFNFPEDFNENEPFEQCCAFQTFEVHVNALYKILTDKKAVLTAKSDETKTLLLYPSEKTLETFPRFKTLISLHKKLRQQLQEDNQKCTASAEKIFSILEQIQNRLRNTSNFLVRSINEMNAETSTAKCDYISASIELCKLRAAFQICENKTTDFFSIYHHQEKLLTYTETEDKFIKSIIDYEKLKKYLETITKFKEEAKSDNSKLENFVDLLKIGPNKRVKEDPDLISEKETERKINEISNEQMNEAFEGFANCFNIAGDMVESASNYIGTTTNIGKIFDNVDHMANTVSKVPAVNWGKSVEEQLKKAIEEKKQMLQKYKEEKQKLEEENKPKEEKEEKCKDEEEEDEEGK